MISTHTLRTKQGCIPPPQCLYKRCALIQVVGYQIGGLSVCRIIPLVVEVDGNHRDSVMRGMITFSPFCQINERWIDPRHCLMFYTMG